MCQVFFIWWELRGSNPQTLPTCQSGCSEPLPSKASIRFLLFHFLTSLSLLYASIFVANVSLYTNSQSLAFAV